MRRITRTDGHACDGFMLHEVFGRQIGRMLGIDGGDMDSEFSELFFGEIRRNGIPLLVNDVVEHETAMGGKTSVKMEMDKSAPEEMSFDGFMDYMDEWESKRGPASARKRLGLALVTFMETRGREVAAAMMENGTAGYEKMVVMAVGGRKRVVTFPRPEWIENPDNKRPYMRSSIPMTREIMERRHICINYYNCLGFFRGSPDEIRLLFSINSWLLGVASASGGDADRFDTLVRKNFSGRYPGVDIREIEDCVQHVKAIMESVDDKELLPEFFKKAHGVIQALKRRMLAEHARRENGTTV